MNHLSAQGQKVGVLKVRGRFQVVGVLGAWSFRAATSLVFAGVQGS